MMVDCDPVLTRAGATTPSTLICNQQDGPTAPITTLTLLSMHSSTNSCSLSSLLLHSSFSSCSSLSSAIAILRSSRGFCASPVPNSTETVFCYMPITMTCMALRSLSRSMILTSASLTTILPAILLPVVWLCRGSPIFLAILSSALWLCGGPLHIPCPLFRVTVSLPS